MEAALITTCGANCNVCAGYLGYKYDIQSKGIRAGYCRGCDSKKSQCVVKKKKCKLLPDGQVKYCYECAEFPCGNLRDAARQLLIPLGMNMIENTGYIKEHGIEAYFEKEEKVWRRPECGWVDYCYECAAFPCSIIQQIDKRYRAHHHTSMIENLEYIRDNGMEAFLEKEEEKWKCPECGGVICCHNGICYNCGLEKLKNKKGNKYRWEGEK